eukprot:PITA_35287
MKFLTENIFTRFGRPHKLVINNAAAFKAKELVDMCDSMGIKLVHSTSYYPQGNGLAESSNKSLMRIIKKLLEDNKRNWDSKLKFALCADREEQNEENDTAKRISDLAEVHQIRDQLIEKSATHQKRIKEAFDRKEKMDNFQVGDLVLKWDALKEKKGNHGNFDALWIGPFVISQIQGKNTFMLQSMEGETIFYGPVNGWFLKVYVV